MTAGQRQQRYRDKLRGSLPAPPPLLDLQTLDAEAITVRILEAAAPEKADRIAATLNHRVVVWRCDGKLSTSLHRHK